MDERFVNAFGWNRGSKSLTAAMAQSKPMGDR
jgi:hypothetical protein